MPNFPKYDRKNEPTPSLLPDDSEFDVSLVESEYKRAQTGRDMMAIKIVVDNGKHQGGSAQNNFVFGTESEFGEKMLQAMANRSRTDDGKLNPGVDADGNLVYVETGGGYTTDPDLAQKDDDGDPVLAQPGGFVFRDDLQSWDAFCAQFVQNPPLRFRIRTWHSYRAEKSDGWKNVTRDEFDQLKAQGDRVAINLNFRVVGPPEQPAAINMAKPKPHPAGGAGGDGAPAFPGTARAPQQAMADDDKLPF